LVFGLGEGPFLGETLPFAAGFGFAAGFVVFL